MKGRVFHGYTPIPHGNQVYLERPRINRLLEKAVQKPIVSIVAGAGYGKSCAAYAYARNTGTRTVWIQFTGQDNTPARFWENFVSAFSVISSGRAGNVRKPGLPANEEQFREYLAVFQGDCVPDGKYLFVYDDFHLITGKTVLHFLERWIASIAPNVTSLIISRKDPPFNPPKPGLKKQLARITGEDLKFTQDEMVSYFRTQNLSPGPRLASTIYRDTEGWAFAIHLAGLSLKNGPSWWKPYGGSTENAGPAWSPGAAYIPQTVRSNVFKFIGSEVMAHISPELQRFLVKLPLIENLNPDLLREIAEDPALVKEMEGISSFVRFDSILNSYRIHPIFFDFLTEKQDWLNCGEKKDVWTKAARWCAANNRKEDAICNYEKIGNYDGIINVLYSLPMVLPVPMATFVLGVLDRAPETLCRDFPMFTAIRARVLVSLGRYAQARAELLEAIPELESRPESSAVHRALTACYLQLGFIGFILATHTKQYGFIRYFKKGAAEYRLSGHTVTAPANGINIGFHACRVTDPSPAELEKFIKAVGGMVPYTVEAMGGCQAGMYGLVRGELAFYRGSHGEAAEHFLEALKDGSGHGQHETVTRSLFYLLRISLARGDAGEAEKILKKLEAGLDEPCYPNRFFYYDIFTGWFHIQTGRKNLIAPWLRSDYLESDLNDRGQGLEMLVKAKYCFSENRYPAALAFLKNRENLDVFVMGSIEMKVLEAVCRLKMQDREGAYKALFEAWKLASPAGLFMPFTESGKDMRALAEAAVKDKAPGLPLEWLEAVRRNAAVYAKKLYRLTAGAGAERIKGQLLSYREMDVLTALSHGLTREEIAGAASISPNTVKSVTGSIYNKLGALNQADAVRIATAKGILPGGG